MKRNKDEGLCTEKGNFPIYIYLYMYKSIHGQISRLQVTDRSRKKGRRDAVQCDRQEMDSETRQIKEKHSR